MPWRTGLILVAIVTTALAAVAQEKSGPAAAATPAAQFAKLNGEFRGLIAQLNQLRRRYQSDPDADKKALQGEFDEKIKASFCSLILPAWSAPTSTKRRCG
jgi:hypothetical protein